MIQLQTMKRELVYWSETMKKSKKRKKDTLKIIVNIVLIFLIVFTVACFAIFAITGNEPANLIQWVFTVFGVELLATMAKAIINKKYGGNVNE